MMDIRAHKPSLVGGALALLLLGVLAFKELPHDSLLQRVVDSERSRLPRNTTAPDFSLPGINRTAMSLADLKGAMSLLVFVTPTCPYCKQLKEELITRNLPDLKERLVFITAKTQTAQELPAEVQALEKKVVSQFPVLEDSSGSVAASYQATNVPTTYLLDGEGKVVDSAVGAPEGLKLAQKLVDHLLAAQAEGCDSCQ
jgi:peroxiredoxin